MLDTLFDEKIGGSFHLTPGQAYEIADNGNRSRIHWDLVLIQRPDYGGGEIWFDGELLRKRRPLRAGGFAAIERRALSTLASHESMAPCRATSGLKGRAAAAQDDVLGDGHAARCQPCKAARRLPSVEVLSAAFQAWFAELLRNENGFTKDATTWITAFQDASDTTRFRRTTRIVARRLQEQRST